VTATQKLLIAKEFAEKVHAKQVRKYTNEPYCNHLAEVASLTREFGGDITSQAAAWVHDSREDQGVTKAEIEHLLGREVADMVEALSDMEEGNRATRKALSRMRLSKASAEVQTIKIADIISNTRMIVKHDPKFARVYLREKKELLAVLTKANPAAHKMASDIVNEGLLTLSRLSREAKHLGSS
tara:strand:+ start:1278 stop:1829 length:552 start_codon:yes stop_codon:yes gene_type:complete